MMNNTEKIIFPVSKHEYKVLVRCFTFNQSKYIEGALNGFAMQQTDFPFVCLVMDDASTDGEQDVIKKWMERECDMSRAEIFDIQTSAVIIVPHMKNAFCSFAFYLLKQNLYKAKEEKMSHVTPWRERCKYEAMCEGDDYWIDPMKLQKQVNIMDENPDLMLCGTNGVVLWENNINRAIVFNSFHDNQKLSPSDIIGRWIFPTAGLLYRTSLVRDWPIWTNQIYSGDLTLVLFALARGGVYAIKDVSCVYRCDDKGNSISTITGRETVVRHHIFLYENYNSYTSQRYNEFIIPYLDSLKSELKYIVAKKKGYLYAFWVSPKRLIMDYFNNLVRRMAKRIVNSKKTLA